LDDSVLNCPPLAVRSAKALNRAETAELNKLSINSACYRISGIESPSLQLHGNNVELHLEDGEKALFRSAKNCNAVFFDQTSYMFSIELLEAEEAYLFSPIASWCESTDWNSRAKTLSIPINFGNDLGDFELSWEWVGRDGERHRASFSGQVFSTKLDIYKHFRIMLDEVKDRFQWIQLDLLRQTTWGWSHDTEADSNLRTWLLIFQEVRETMGERFKKLIHQHRRRLLEETQMLRAEQMKKISPKLEERVVEGLRDNPNQRYPMVKKVLDADTPENRFMKHILFQTLSQLNVVINKIEKNERFADIFKDRLKEWAGEWSVLNQHRFWRGIGEFRGLRRASLILSQDPIYAGIRRANYLLQQGLIFLDQDLKGGIQNAAQLYEVWCFVKMDQLITESGWSQVDETHLNFELTDNSLSDDREELQAGTVKFAYGKDGFDNISLSLLFQPTAGEKLSKDGIWDGMMAVPVNQQPDLVLRLHRDDLPQKPVYTWIFDAKYRLHKNNAPEDAVNQMHRYRDAIIWASDTGGEGRLTRESIGAYVLYPGDDSTLDEKSKQIASVQKTNIGAYPLRPDNKNTVSSLLKNQVESFLDVSQEFGKVEEKQAEYYAGVPGLKAKQKPLFAKCITKSADKMNTQEYWENSRLYRLPNLAVKKENLEPWEWTYLIPTSGKGEQLGNFPILSVKLMARHDISQRYVSEEIPIYSKTSADDDLYWLFVLGEQLENMPILDSIEEGKVVFVGELDNDLATNDTDP
jgi:predicted component of viral defense system (DUF524 family)